ncbi:MAG TPA: TOBE domain-containing protein, partial [Clostridia bacterium]|nr:TOBE domain-containing protein [Clostridia bacterium]
LGDRIVIMKDGFIQQVGTPQEVFEKPVNLFVAGFIGSPQMNIFNADLIKEQQGRYTVVVQDLRLPIDADKCALMADRGVGSQAVKLGVRPEHAQIHFDNAPDTLEGTLAVNEMMGSEYHLHVITKDEQTIILRTPTVDLSEKQRASLKAGNKLRFSFPSKVIQLFDPKSEQSLLYT